MDEVDIAGDRQSVEEERRISAIRKIASNIPEGYPGECESCGLESGRLVNDMCAPCRDMTY